MYVAEFEGPPVVVTTTEMAPAEWSGAVAVIWVAELTAKLAAVPPKVTEVAPVRLVPVMTTEVPPAVGPLVGLRPEMLGPVT